jgi:hypothetical protein
LSSSYDGKESIREYYWHNGRQAVTNESHNQVIKTSWGSYVTREHCEQVCDIYQVAIHVRNKGNNNGSLRGELHEASLAEERPSSSGSAVPKGIREDIVIRIPVVPSGRLPEESREERNGGSHGDSKYCK